MSGYCPYDKLTYRPTIGYVDIRGHEKEFQIPVSINTGRALEADGVPVMWAYGSCPAWVAEIGLAGPWMLVARIITAPSRWLGR